MMRDIVDQETWDEVLTVLVDNGYRVVKVPDNNVLSRFPYGACRDVRFQAVDGSLSMYVSSGIETDYDKECELPDWRPFTEVRLEGYIGDGKYTVVASIPNMHDLPTVLTKIELALIDAWNKLAYSLTPTQEQEDSCQDR